ncbi:hypothetical protein [Streptomyces sp. NPDC091278]|uniref:hypothetical protein n=1 Tax=Streptomyces sp. NPDC091278 TaxID=3155301 RepID=UPI0034500E9A
MLTLRPRTGRPSGGGIDKSPEVEQHQQQDVRLEDVGDGGQRGGLMPRAQNCAHLPTGGEQAAGIPVETPPCPDQMLRSAAPAPTEVGAAQGLPVHAQAHTKQEMSDAFGNSGYPLKDPPKPQYIARIHLHRYRPDENAQQQGPEDHSQHGQDRIEDRYQG